MRCLEVHVCLLSLRNRRDALEQYLSFVGINFDYHFKLLFIHLSLFMLFHIVLFHNITRSNPALHIILSQCDALFLSLPIYVLRCFRWPCWVFSVELILLISFTASLEFCLTCKAVLLHAHVIYIYYINSHSGTGSTYCIFCLSAGLNKENVPQPEREHRSISWLWLLYVYRLTLLMGAVRYPNWANAPSASGPCYLSACVCSI